MLTLVGYNICDPRRLRREARVCEDFGIRVQDNIFECHLDEQKCERFGSRLRQKIEPSEDRLVAYQIDARSAKKKQGLQGRWSAPTALWFIWCESPSSDNFRSGDENAKNTPSPDLAFYRGNRLSSRLFWSP